MWIMAKGRDWWTFLLMQIGRWSRISLIFCFFLSSHPTPQCCIARSQHPEVVLFMVFSYGKAREILLFCRSYGSNVHPSPLPTFSLKHLKHKLILGLPSPRLKWIRSRRWKEEGSHTAEQEMWVRVWGLAQHSMVVPSWKLSLLLAVVSLSDEWKGTQSSNSWWIMTFSKELV